MPVPAPADSPSAASPAPAMGRADEALATSTGAPAQGAALESTPAARAATDLPALGSAPEIEVVIPVHNEEKDLGPSVRRLHAFLSDGFPFTFQITIADNASTDGTWMLAGELADTFPEVTALHLPEKGRGRALRAVWSASRATVVAYMDVDLSTDLGGLLPLVAPLMSGHSDVAIGSRLAPGARVVRGPKREMVSRCYNSLLKAALRVRFSDAQCGFKAMRAEVARGLLPLVEDTAWFFDTELLVLAERSGLRIHEVPVDWVDDPDSRVDIVPTALADLRGIARVRRALLTGRLPVDSLRDRLGRAPLSAGPPERSAPAGALRRQLVTFVGIGGLSTLAYLGLYALLRALLASSATGLAAAAAAQVANVVALGVTAVANTAANGRLTFGARRVGARHHLGGLGVFGIGLALTAGALGILHTTAPDTPRTAELAVLVAANLLATVVRFVALRAWVFRDRRGARETSSPTSARPDLPVVRPRDPETGS